MSRGAESESVATLRAHGNALKNDGPRPREKGSSARHFVLLHWKIPLSKGRLDEKLLIFIHL